jgi:serine/threonine-protein kinase
MSDLLKPDQIFAGRYKVVAFLAKGGFGAVYSAEQTDTEAKVALKVLWPHLLDSDLAVEQFKLEAKLSNRIASEHVVRVYDVGQEVGTGKVYLSMELLEGKDFEDLVKEQGPIAPREVAVYFRQIASALEKAHNYLDKSGDPRPIVHRDLKPENLFLTHRETGEPCVKILDFGLAKVLGESGRTSNEFKGTPLFMSYEQASVGAITPQTDIWALGLVAFYLLTGRCYWLSAVDVETPITRIFSEVLSGPMSAPSERARSLGVSAIPSPAFDAWFARTVTRSSTHRFGSISECVAELLAVLDSMPAASASRGVVPMLPSPPDTTADAALLSIPEGGHGEGAASEALRTLQSARPPSDARGAGGETASPQSFDLPGLKPPSPVWRALILAGLVAGLFLLGLVFVRSQPSGDAVPLSSGPDPGGSTGPRSARAGASTAGIEPAQPLPALPLAETSTDAAAARPSDSARGVQDSAAGARRPRVVVQRSPVLPGASVTPAPVTVPDEDPYGSR